MLNDAKFRYVGNTWGYYLEGRGYEQTPNYESPNYKFTSKERDRESNYDYFGARYYDSRIGRWGQVEPLMDKYVSFSTYCYGLNNPVIMKDLDGRDAIVTINNETKEINIDVKIYFTMDEKPGGFSTEESKNLLTSYLQEAQTQWQDAFSQVEHYKVSFNIIPEFVSQGQLNWIKSELKSSRFGENVAGFFEKRIAPGVISNELLLVSMEGKSAPRYTGSHEIGHLIGFPHTYPDDSDAQKESTNVMGYNPNREKPTKYDALRFINKLDKSKNIQVVRGARNFKQASKGELK